LPPEAAVISSSKRPHRPAEPTQKQAAPRGSKEPLARCERRGPRRSPAAVVPQEADDVSVVEFGSVEAAWIGAQGNPIGTRLTISRKVRA
jgi:hypothetical protein